MVHAHNVFIGVVLDAGICIDLRNDRPGTGGNDDLIATDDMVASLYGLGANKASVFVVDGDIRGFLTAAVLLAALGNLVDAVVKDAVHNGVPVHAVDLSI